MSYYGTYYSTELYPESTVLIFLGIAALLSVIGGIAIYFTFLSRKNEYRFKGFWGKLYDFLSFHTLLIDSILKILYLIAACFMTIGGFFLMFSSFLGGLLMIVGGNVITRLAYEFAMLLIIICQNTTQLNKTLRSNGFKEEYPHDAASRPDSRETQAGQGSFTDQNGSGFSCPVCGAKTGENDAYCSSCGAKL